jgi:hypothetical protein
MRLHLADRLRRRATGACIFVWDGGCRVLSLHARRARTGDEDPCIMQFSVPSPDFWCRHALCCATRRYCPLGQLPGVTKPDTFATYRGVFARTGSSTNFKPRFWYRGYDHKAATIGDIRSWIPLRETRCRHGSSVHNLSKPFYCCRAAARSAPIRLASTRRSLKPTSIRIGLPAFRSAP